MPLQITKLVPVLRSPNQHGVFLQWVFSTAPAKDVSSFTIERSGSSEGPFELVVSNLDSYNYFDGNRDTPTPSTGDTRENVNFLSLTRTIYYRVTAVFADNSTEGTVRVVSANIRQKKIQLLRRKMQRDLAVGLKFNGTDIVVLKRRHWGVRCKACFDLLTKKVTNSKCNICYGTGFTGGYFAPVRILGRLGVNNVQTQITEKDKTDINKKRATLLDVPIIETDDVIVDIQNNKRYIVQTRHSTELQTVAVHQQLTISELARDSVEYRIPVNADHIPVIY